MKTLNTVAKNAEDEVYSILSTDNHVYRPWQLIDYELEPLRLQVTESELVSYLQVDAFVRPGFEVTDEVVVIPHIFVKIDGKHPDLVKNLKKIRKIKPEKVMFIDNILLMNRKPMSEFFKTRPEWYDDENGINIHHAMSENLDSLMILKPKYRENYLKAVDRVIKSVRDGSVLIKKPTARVMLETLIYNNTKVVEMYHDFDYQYMVPKFVIEIEKDKTSNIYAVLRMMLMSELGFDVVVIEEEGYSSIENILSEDEFDIYTIRDVDSHVDISDDLKNEGKKKKEHSGFAIFGYVLLAIIILAFLSVIPMMILGVNIFHAFF